MTVSWRPMVLAAAFCLTVAAGVADAQIVMVRNAPPGSAIDLVLNSATIGSATADATGGATLSVKLQPNVTETDVHVYVDVCEKARRVLLIERGLQPDPPPSSCQRTDIVGWFLLQKVTSMVVDAGGAAPSVWLKQGPIPREWLLQEAGAPLNIPPRKAPKGLVVYAGGGFDKFSNTVNLECGSGTVSTCTGKDFRPTYTVGVGFWVMRFLEFDVNYVKPADVTVTGSDVNFRFDSALHTQMLTVGAKVGAPIGPARVYGLGGVNYHRATFSATETINDTTITVDSVTQTIPGGTQSSSVETRGWGYVFGGGVEGWVTPVFAIYAEAGRVNLHGTPVGGGEVGLDERLTFIHAGVRVHIGLPGKTASRQ